MAASAVVLVPEIINEALTALNAILAVINGIHSQGGMTADQILASAQAMQQANNTLYATLIASLQKPPMPGPPPVQ
jgi:hypothetical protein